MANVPTHEQLVDIARDEMEAGNAVWDPATIDVEGHPSNILVHVGASMADEVARQVVRLEAKSFLDTAEGEDLDRLVWDRYGLTRLGAAPSLGEVAFTRPGAGYGAITIPSGTVLLADDGTRFLTVEAAVFSGAALGPITAEIRSETAGAGQKALAGEIETFETTPADSSMLVTNAADTAGDSDAETDAELRERAREFFQNARRGTLAAIEYGAKTVPGVKFAVATEVTTLSGQPNRWVKLQVADRNGGSSSALTAAVEAALEEWRAAGMRVQVIGATVTFVEIAIQLVIDSAYDDNVVGDAVRDAIVGTLAQFDPGQTLYHSDIIQAAKAVDGVVDVPAVTDPVAALEPDDDEVFRTKAELITLASP